MAIATSQAQRLRALANPQPYQPSMVDHPLRFGDSGPLAPTVFQMPVGDVSLPNVKRPGLFDRIGMELDKPGVRAALLRSGMATFDGGPSAGMRAADQFLSDRAQSGLEQQRLGLQGRQVDIQQQQADQTGAHFDRSDTNEAARDAADAAFKTGQLAVQRGNQRLQYQLHVTPSGNTIVEAQTSRANNMDNNETARMEEGGRMTRFNNPSADQKLQSETTLGAARIGAGIGSKAKVGTITRETAGHPAVDGYFRDTPAMPKTTEQIDVLPMPASRDQAVVGAVYSTSRGPMRWTGQEFVNP